MQFLFPTFLFAFSALAIPVIIHLFYFRRFKRVYFTNVRFLKEVKEETSNRRRLRNLLVLLMRCLAIIFLVLAFAQPFIPLSTAVKKGEKSVSLYIDNSFSMNALSKAAPLLELAKQRARDIVSAYAPDDRFQVLTNDFEGRDQRLVSKEEALLRIDEIRTAPASRNLSKVLQRQQQCLNMGKAENKVSFLISDFQQNISDLGEFKDSLLTINLVPMRAVQENNVSIDSVWFDNPVQILNQPANLLVKISNRGNETAEEVRLSLRHDGQTKPVGAVKIPAGASRLDTVHFNILQPGWHTARVSITDYPIQFDDDYYFSFYVAEHIRVLDINNGKLNKYLENAFIGPKYFQLDHADARALDYSKFGDYQLIVLNDLTAVSSGLASELKAFAQNGGNIVVFPGENANLSSFNGFLAQFDAGPLGAFENQKRQGAQINLETFVFRDVYLNKSANLRLPTTTGNFRIAASNRGEQVLSYRDGSALMSKFQQGAGALYLYAAPLDDKISDLVRNGEIFVPMLFKMAIAGAKSLQIAYSIGKDEVLEAKHVLKAGGESIYKLKLAADDAASTAVEGVPAGQEFIPEQRVLGSKVLLTPGKSIQAAGWYTLAMQSDSTLATYSFNFDRRESDLRCQTQFSDLPKQFHVLDAQEEANFGQVVGDQDQGIVLWRWCVVFALLFLALEVLFLRLWKTAS